MSQRLSRVVVLLCALAACAAHAVAQGVAVSGGAAPPAAAGRDASLDEVLRLLREQREELAELRAKLAEQARVVEELRERVGRDVQSAAGVAAAPRAAAFAGALYPRDAEARQQPGARQDDEPLEERVAGVESQAKKTGEALAKQLGSISFSGDLRLRYESTYGQLNAQPNGADPSVLGNELTSRNRFRLRARLAVRGQIGKDVEWGLRFATGNTPDVISTNQTFTDFFSRKQFALDQAYVTYKPSRLRGFQVQAGKFDVPWLRTEMTIDSDLTVEGFSESYSRDFKTSALRNLTFVAWQLPMLERNSAFVLGSDGRVDLAQSRRAGRDLALYGAQLRARFELSEALGLTLSADDLYYSGTQFITPAQAFGPNVQVPVTVTIPATATSPAQTVNGLAAIPRDQLASGNANLGVSVANNNATNRDGRLSSGFNLVNLIGRLDYARSPRWPVVVLVNFVKNTQARDVVLAGPGGTTRVLPNDEDQGFWAEFQVGRTQQRGESLFNYTFIRIEKDAVLTPFNHSDILQQSDIRVHRFNVAYALDPRVTLSVTSFVNQRPNGLLGPFGATPAGSLDRPTTRLQLDTIFRF